MTTIVRAKVVAMKTKMKRRWLVNQVRHLNRHKPNFAGATIWLTWLVYGSVQVRVEYLENSGVFVRLNITVLYRNVRSNIHVVELFCRCS